MKIGPLFKWFGSKWMSSRLLPVPIFDHVIEPFAGGAGYALNHCDKQVALYESDPHIALLWPWLIGEATSGLIRDIPIGVAEGTDIRTLGLTSGQALLLKSWQRTNNVGSCWTISPWGNKPGQWTANTRARVAEQISAIKHWKWCGRDGMAFLTTGEHFLPETTWMIDPPYQYNYQYKSLPMDYLVLGSICQTLPGQVLVCEAICSKTGATPIWLPFEFFGSRVTSRRKTCDHHHSKELLYQRPKKAEK